MTSTRRGTRAVERLLYVTPSQTTDVANAERLVGRYGHNLRYCWSLGSWLRWDGKRWLADDGGHIHACARETARRIYGEAASAADTARRTELAKWASASESALRIEAMIKVARTLDAVQVRVDELDADPWVLTVLNGTLDLRTGELRAHRREDLITKIAPVTYLPGTRHALWNHFVETAIPESSTRAYVQRCLGASLLGVPLADRVYFFHGPGGTGKSTCREAIASTLGDYAAAADFEAFAAKRSAGGPKPEIIALRGARIVFVSEVEKGARLAHALVKQLSGGDRIAVRDLYKGEVTFVPTFTLCIMANERPRIREDDSGMWRRLQEIPFANVFTKPDQGVRAQLRNPAIAGSAILAWLIEGCLAAQRDGLPATPPQVLAATSAYREAMNPLGDFFNMCCVFEPVAWTSSTSLRACYEQFCRERGEAPVRGTDFTDALRGRGLEPKARGHAKTRGWEGIRLRGLDM